jgi:predicted transcriptional regulator
MNDDQQIHDWQVEAIKRGIREAARGKGVPHDKVRAWAKSLGSGRELPVPKSN